MSHAELEDLAGLALDHGDVPPDVQDHVDACPQCAEAVVAFVAARAQAGAGPLVEPPQHLRDQVMAHVRHRGRGRAPRRARDRPAHGQPRPDARGGRPGRGTVVAAADLTALDSDASRGVASAVEKDDTLTLRVSAEGLDDGDGVHEVWLIDTDGKRMWPSAGSPPATRASSRCRSA